MSAANNTGPVQNGDGKTKLSKRQRQVVNDLNRGYVIVADSASAGAWIAHKNGDQYHINNRVFFNLVDKGAIRQQMISPFDYILTEDFLKGGHQ